MIYKHFSEMNIHPCAKVMALFLDMDINGLISVLQKYKTSVIKFYVLTCIVL